MSSYSLTETEFNSIDNIITSDHDRSIKPKFNKTIVYAIPNVTPVNKRFTVMKDVTENVETYT